MAVKHLHNSRSQHTPGYSGIHIKRPGLLHSKLGVPQGQKIPANKLAIHPGDSPALRKEKQFAINAKSFHHGSKNN